MKKFLERLEDALLVFLLRRLGSIMSAKVFFAVAEKFVISTVNLLIFRNERKEVLLTRRPLSDPYWPGLWHIPGTAIRESDDIGIPVGSSDPMKRLEMVEIKTKLKSAPKLVLIKPISCERGKEITFVYFIEEGVFPCGRFFPIDALPEMVAWQRLVVQEVLEHME